MTSLDAALARAAERWGVVLDGPPSWSPSGCVAFGHRGEVPVVVKVSSAASDERLAAAALRQFGGRGSVALLDADGDAVLLARVRPGTPLATLVRAGRDDEAMAIVCDVAAALHGVGPPAGEFPPVERWGEAFDHYRSGGGVGLPAALVARAAATFDELAATQGARCLLHGDLHHDNILLDDAHGWLAIDPKGAVGEPAYEFGAALRNPFSDAARIATPAAVDRRARIIEERSGLDRARVLGWAFAQAVLSEVWSWEDGEPHGHGVALAGAILAAL